MRLLVGVELEATLLQFGQRVRRRGFDPINLPGKQRRGARICFRHRQEHHLVDLGHAVLIPVARILDELEPFARGEARHLPRAGARRVLGERGPCGLRLRLGVSTFRLVVEGLPLRRARHEEIGEVDRQEAVGLLGGELDGHVVDLLRGCQRRHARGRDADLAGVELRRVLLQHLLDIPHHGVCVERRTVMEGDTRPQLESPFCLVGIVDLPLGGKAGDHHARLVGRGQIPAGERVVHGEAGEAVAFKTLIGLTQRARNIGSSHGDAQHGVGTCDARPRSRAAERQQRDQRRAGLVFIDQHCLNPFSGFDD
ncbi:hypothetical protein ACVWZW_007668 [Bradyrhizobium sp. F1.13.4]